MSLPRTAVEKLAATSLQAPAPPRSLQDSNPRRALLWLQPGLQIKRWLMLFALCTFLGAVGFLHFTWTGPLHFTATKWILFLNNFIQPEVLPLYVMGVTVMILAISGAIWSVVMLNRTVLRGTGTAPEIAAHLLLERHTLSKGARIVAVGGGTGLSTLLSGLKQYSRNLTAIVTVADDGGSSGRLRQSLNMVAPGDLTDCYAALSDSPVLSRLLLHRFERGEGLSGHTFGNLMLATLSEEQGDLGTAMQDIHEVLNVRGQVFPATTRSATLVARLEDGQEIRGESQLSQRRSQSRIQEVRLEPPDLPALPQVLVAIREAELIVLGPGSLYTSIIPALLIPDIARAIRQARAPLVYVASIMTEPGETSGMTLSEHVQALSSHLGRSPDLILMNDTPIHPDVQTLYRREGAMVVDLNGADRELRRRIRLTPLVRSGTARHDPEALAQALLTLSQAGERRTLD